MPLRFLFVMDPLERIDIHGDSTFVLMLESQRRGHEVLYCTPKALFLDGPRAGATAQPASLRRVPGDHFTLGPAQSVWLDDLDAVFLRKDPPFDPDYLLCTWVLDRVDRRRVVLVNDPRGVRDSNEKLTALHFSAFTPPTLVAADRARLRAFLQQHGRAVVKPLLNAGGAGVILLEHGHKNVGSVLDLLTQEGSRLIEIQAYLEAVDAGDKRIVLLDGLPIGAVNRRPQPGDIRANMHVGGVAEPAKLTPREQEICAALGPELSRRGLVFVGIDVIGGYLTEVNVTSPTGLQEIGRFDGVCLEAQIIDWVENKRTALG